MTAAQCVAKCTSRAVFHPLIVVSVHGHVGDREWLWCPWCEIQPSISSGSLPYFTTTSPPQLGEYATRGITVRHAGPSI